MARNEKLAKATLGVCKDKTVLRDLKGLLASTHKDLNGASIELMWAYDRALTFWGNTRVVSEETWWVSGQDIIVQLNYDLWRKLGAEARTGVLAHQLSLVRARTTGSTQMDTTNGTRTLFQTNKPASFPFHDWVIAKWPAMKAEIPELARFGRAFNKPEQFLLTLAEDQSAEAPEKSKANGAPPAEPKKRRAAGPKAVPPPGSGKSGADA